MAHFFNDFNYFSKILIKIRIISKLLKILLNNLKEKALCLIFALSTTKKRSHGNRKKSEDLKHCGVMKFLADMPSRLEGGEFRINLV